LATQQFSAAFFGEGTTAAGVFSMPGTLGDEAFRHLKETWPKGLPNAHHPLFLEDGMDWKSMTVPPEEAQMLETIQFTVVDLARWFRMPPHKIQHLANATFSNIEMQAIEYVGDTLQPHYVRWEQEIKRKLVSPNEPDVFAEHLIVGLLRGDQAARSTFYRERFNIGTLSQNDIRELENENGIGPEGDKYYVPMNLTSGDEEEKPEPAEPAVPVPPAIPREDEVTESMKGIFLVTAQRVVRTSGRTSSTTSIGRSFKRHFCHRR
jgi:phage portal protein BeeE